MESFLGIVSLRGTLVRRAHLSAVKSSLASRPWAAGADARWQECP
jgi:hypothetical protein